MKSPTSKILTRLAPFAVTILGVLRHDYMKASFLLLFQKLRTIRDGIDRYSCPGRKENPVVRSISRDLQDFSFSCSNLEQMD